MQTVTTWIYWIYWYLSIYIQLLHVCTWKNKLPALFFCAANRIGIFNSYWCMRLGKSLFSPYTARDLLKNGKITEWLTNCNAQYNIEFVRIGRAKKSFDLVHHWFRTKNKIIKWLILVFKMLSIFSIPWYYQRWDKGCKYCLDIAVCADLWVIRLWAASHSSASPLLTVPYPVWFGD